MVVAHPHDFTHMAGTCAHHIEDGDSVAVVSITGGGRTHNERLHDQLLKDSGQRDEAILDQVDQDYVAEKAGQFKDACGLFGITDVRILPFSDVPLVVTDKMVKELTDLVCEVRPHILLTHAPDHPVSTVISMMDDDHMNAGKAVRMAMRMANAPDPERKRKPHTIPAIYYMGMEFPDFDVNFFVDIADQAENRLRAEAMFTSQGHTVEFAQKRLEVEVGHRGWVARHSSYAEPFVRAGREVGRKLTLTQLDLEAAEMNAEERHHRKSYRVT